MEMMNNDGRHWVTIAIARSIRVCVALFVGLAFSACTAAPEIDSDDPVTTVSTAGGSVENDEDSPADGVGQDDAPADDDVDGSATTVDDDDADPAEPENTVEPPATTVPDPGVSAGG